MSALTKTADAQANLQEQFDRRKCKREDARQAAARIVREATEDRTPWIQTAPLSIITASGWPSSLLPESPREALVSGAASKALRAMAFSDLDHVGSFC
jgi:hypothetical protein